MGCRHGRSWAPAPAPRSYHCEGEAEAALRPHTCVDLEEEHRAAVAKARGDWARSAAELLAAVDADADARAPAAAPAAAVEAK